MVQTGASTAPGVNPVEGAAAAVGSAATGANLAFSNKELFENVMNELGNQYDQGVKDFSDWFLPKVFEFGENFDKAIDPDTWRDFIKEKFDEAGEAWDKFQKDLGDWLLPNLLDWSDTLGDWLDLNRDGKYHVYDPLVLDLDGDGIETVGTQGYKGALFDHNSDGIRTSTGWISADDGLLVIDRNGDGLINNGGELFGDGTVLKDGSNAAHGYAVLAEFDTNSDGKVDAQDADFAKLKVWRDLNQDGVSQEGELFTLAELNIQSLDVAYQDVNTRLGNGNTLAQKGSYTLADGTTREMGDLLFAADHLHSRYAVRNRTACYVV
ncbi:hypothetical protein [Neisseria yangbaofengii]|uniref:hypothetical protein n=1 Tax=Neisseria yangbaofengii TaxID=2709396 RepID=UPI0035309DDC